MRKQLRCIFILFEFLENTCICVQLYGEKACWGHYTLYFEALKGFITQKRTLIFFSDFCRKCHTAIPEHNQVDPIGGLNLKV